MKKIANQSLLHARAMADAKNARLQPPADMPKEQQLVWHTVVDFLPSDWFAREQSALLVAYCRHVCRADQIEVALAGIDPLENLEQFDKLSKLAGLESAKIAMFARSMRLTQQSRLKAETASGRAGAAAGAASFERDALDEFLLA